jgi:hypothetical protein
MQRITRIALMSVGLGICIVWTACNQSDTAAGAKMMGDTAGYTTIQWLDSIVNFDTINMGEKTNIVFRFRNSGDKVLYLSEVKAGCGCTVADYTKGAIAPGQQGEVTGAFDSNKSHPGEVRKQILVTANTKGVTRHKLIFDGWIREKK